MKRTIFSLLCIACTFSLFAVCKEEKKILDAMFNAQIKLTKNFSCERVNDQQMIEVGLNPLSDKRPYHLILKGLPPKTQFDLYVIALMNFENPQYFGSGYIDKQGDAVINMEEGQVTSLSRIYLYAPPFLLGEPIYHLLVIKNKKKFLAASHVPLPIECFGKEGRHVWMEIITPNKEGYIIQGEHFAPGEKISLFPMSSNGTTPLITTASKKGTFVAFLENEAKDPKNDYLYEIQISSPQQIEPMVMQYTWGYLKEKTKQNEKK